MKQIYRRALWFLPILLSCPFVGNAQQDRIYQIETQPESRIAGHNKSGCDCDTLPLPPDWKSLHDYFCPGNVGSPCGKNAYNNQEIAGYFDFSGTNYKYLLGAQFLFAAVNTTRKADLAKPVNFKFYEDDNGKPGAQFGPTVKKTICELQHDALVNAPTLLSEFQGIVLPGTKKLYISMDVSQLTWDTTASGLQKNKVPGVRDSVIILSSKNGDETPSTAWTRFTNGKWRNYSEVYHLDIGLAIRPVVSTSPNGCGTVMVQNSKPKPVIRNVVAQNPFTNSINIQLDFQKAAYASVTLYNLQGSVEAIKEGNFHEGINALQLSVPGNLRADMYVLKVKTGNEEKVIKLLKQ